VGWVATCCRGILQSGEHCGRDGFRHRATELIHIGSTTALGPAAGFEVDIGIPATVYLTGVTSHQVRSSSMIMMSIKRKRPRLTVLNGPAPGLRGISRH